MPRVAKCQKVRDQAPSRAGQAVTYSRRPNTSTAHDTAPVTLRPSSHRTIPSICIPSDSPTERRYHAMHNGSIVHSQPTPLQTSPFPSGCCAARRDWPISQPSLHLHPPPHLHLSSPASGSQLFRLGRRVTAQSGPIVILWTNYRSPVDRVAVNGWTSGQIQHCMGRFGSSRLLPLLPTRPILKRSPLTVIPFEQTWHYCIAISDLTTTPRTPGPLV